ncbi:MAG: hypothetical protein EBR82_53985 [Caulobacteraceae bacterium]|nr:hypothetical protein [Caulobacteraceae bacterium]
MSKSIDACASTTQQSAFKEITASQLRGQPTSQCATSNCASRATTKQSANRGANNKRTKSAQNQLTNDANAFLGVDGLVGVAEFLI